MVGKHGSLPEELDGVAFHVADALEHGVSRRRMRGSDLARPFHGVRVAGNPVNAKERGLAFGPRLGPQQAVGGDAAAAVWGLPLPHTVDRHVEVVVKKGETRATGRGVRSREVRPDLFTCTTIDGLRVTDPLLTWCLLARTATIAELVRTGDAIVSDNDAYVGRRTDFGPVSVVALERAVKAWKGCVGIDRLRAALPQLREHVASPPETDLRLLVLDAGLPEFQVNVPIQHDGRTVAIVDGLIPDLGIVFEYEGDGHRTDQRQFRRDITRYGDLENLGYLVCRATGDDVYRDKVAFQARARQVYERALTRKARESA